MDNNKSADHILNNEVQYYYDRILQKISSNISEKYNSGDYINLGQEEMYISLIMFNKYKIQFYSAISLTYRCTQNPLNQFEYIDIASIQTIIRSCYETFLTFQYIYMQPEFIGEFEVNEFKNDRETYLRSLQLKILLYKYEGYRQSYLGFSSIPEEKEKNKKIYEKYKAEILKNVIIKDFSNKEKNNILNKWRPSWNKIASKTELSIWNSNNMYNIVSQYSHNSYTILMSLNYNYTNLDKFDRDAMIVQLFEFTAILINNYIKLLHIDHSIFDKDEINLLNEFYMLADKNPIDTV